LTCFNVHCDWPNTSNGFPKCNVLFHNHEFGLNALKGLLEKENSVINYSPSSRSKPVRLFYIFSNTNEDLFDEI